VDIESESRKLGLFQNGCFLPLIHTISTSSYRTDLLLWEYPYCALFCPKTRSITKP
jgi:hypothetical protein